MSSYLEHLFSLDGRTALVTGGSSGIGFMMAQALVMAGADVVIASRKQVECEAAVKRLNAMKGIGRAAAIIADVSKEDGIASLTDAIVQRWDALSILINNAGRNWGAQMGEVPYKSWENVFSLNVTAPFELCQRLLPLLSRAGKPDDPARVINTGSSAGIQPIGNNAFSYAASKAAVHHLTRVLARELAGHHVAVNSIAPGPFESRMMMLATPDEVTHKAVTDMVPLRRWGTVSDVAGVTLFLCGRGGAYVTGTVIPVDGGVATNCGGDPTKARD